MKTIHYLIDEKHNVTPCDDIVIWASGFKHGFKQYGIVKQEKIQKRRWFAMWCGMFMLARKPVLISTVFLGIDHNFGSGAPILFETMVFGGKHNGFQQRYSTWREAVYGHEVVKKKVLGKANRT